jgi:predicted nucleic acid-binding protein
MTLVDTNILLDIATADPVWLPWSEQAVRMVCRQGPVAVNPIIYAELAPAFPAASVLDPWLDATVFSRLPLPHAAGWRAAQAFVQYRRQGGAKTSPLPDFYIGAHAEVAGLVLPPVTLLATAPTSRS